MSSFFYDLFINETESDRKKERMIPCLHCKGDGWNYAEFFKCCAKEYQTPFGKIKVTCHVCNGRKVVPAEFNSRKED
jgi:hypothetical protein